jgi:hypothetical protein
LQSAFKRSTDVSKLLAFNIVILKQLIKKTAVRIETIYYLLFVLCRHPGLFLWKCTTRYRRMEGKD